MCSSIRKPISKRISKWRELINRKLTRNKCIPYQNEPMEMKEKLGLYKTKQQMDLFIFNVLFSQFRTKEFVFS